MRAAGMLSSRSMYADIPATVKALLKNSDVEKVYILAEDDDTGVWLPEICETVNVSGQTFFPRGGPNFVNPWTWVLLMKTAFHRLFPQLERILYLDLDAFALHDISELWRLDLDHRLIAAVRETTWLNRPELPYYNTGVMMLNLELLRSSGRGDEIIDMLNRRKCRFIDQDAINTVCSGSVLELPREYNAGRSTEPYAPPKIRHYMGEQDFRGDAVAAYYRDLPWEDVL